MTRSRKRWLISVIVPVEVVSCALAWRDLARRPTDQVRGNKNLWRLFITVNPGNSLFYWLFGRVR
jgi:hypothetical protein